MAVMSLTLTPRDPLSTVISAGAGTKAVTGLTEDEQPVDPIQAQNIAMIGLYGFISGV